jgi:DNA-binding CsgD family transcriptional regulator
MIFGGIIATFAFSIFFIFQMNYFIYVYFRAFEKNLKTINILLLSTIIAGTVYVILFIPNVHNKRTILFTNIALLNLIELIFGFYNIINWKNLKTRIEKKSLQKYALIISVLFAILPFLFFFNLLILNKDMYREIRPLFTITILNIWSILNIYYSIKYFRSSYSKEAKTVSEDFIKNFSITEREKNIIELVNKGLSNKEIADKLNLSLNTVKSYMYNIFQKTQIKSRTALIHLSKKP